MAIINFNFELPDNLKIRYQMFFSRHMGDRFALVWDHTKEHQKLFLEFCEGERDSQVQLKSSTDSRLSFSRREHVSITSSAVALQWNSCGCASVGRLGDWRLRLRKLLGIVWFDIMMGVFIIGVFVAFGVSVRGF